MPKSEDELTSKDLEVGAIVIEPGNASQYRTGDWRSQRPTLDKSKCNPKCPLCYIFCPEGCIGRDAKGYPEFNLFYCKGCGICAQECNRKAITMVEEEE